MAIHHFYLLQVHIKISDVNDNAPQFSQKEHVVNIVESIPLSPPAPILQLRAHDADTTSHLTYSIIAGNEGGWSHLSTYGTCPDILFCRAFKILFTGPLRITIVFCTWRVFDSMMSIFHLVSLQSIENIQD